MHIIRPIESKDHLSLYQLALSASAGILTLPKSKERLDQKIQNSLQSLASNKPPCTSSIYLFLLENLETKSVQGCCAIHASAGIPGEEYYYKIESIQTLRRPIDAIPAEQKLLVPHPQPIEDTSEVGTLFVNPNYRQAGIGRLLSLSRFLFIAIHRERFQKKVMAELRGLSLDGGIIPFWEHITKCFCPIDFEEFALLFENKTLRALDILPTYPIYYSLLPPSVQEAIGKTHENTMPALKILVREGFELLDGVDISDGGPKLYANIDDVRTVKFAKKGKVKQILLPQCEQETMRPHFASTLSIDFKVCYAEVHANSDKEITIDSEAARALQIDVGDSICYISVK